MRVLWNLDKTKAIPLRHIRVFEIIDNTEMDEKDKERLGVKNYSVIVRYQVCSGDWFRVFTADTEEECRTFIYDLQDYLY